MRYSTMLVVTEASSHNCLFCAGVVPFGVIGESIGIDRRLQSIAVLTGFGIAIGLFQA